MALRDSGLQPTGGSARNHEGESPTILLRRYGCRYFDLNTVFIRNILTNIKATD